MPLQRNALNKLSSIDGKIVYADAGFDLGGPNCCCAVCNPPDCTPRALCSDHATCNNFCNSEQAEFERSEACDCPCEGRRAYPQVYQVDYVDIDFITNTFFTLQDGRKIKITGQDSHSFTATICVGGGAICPDDCCFCFVPDNPFGWPYITVSVDYYTSEEVFIESGEILAFWGWGQDGGLAGVPASPTLSIGCADTDPIGRVFVHFFLTWQLNMTVEPENSLAQCNMDGDNQYVEACGGGTVGPDGPVPFGDGIDVLSSAGILIVTPNCEDCIGNKAYSVGDVTASSCGYEYDFVVNVPDGDGGAFRSHIYRLFGGPSGWAGADQYGNTATIETSGTNPFGTFDCCPAHDPNSADCDCGSGCPGCWTAELETAIGEISYFGNGSCPGNWALTSLLTYPPDSSGFVGDCAP